MNPIFLALNAQDWIPLAAKTRLLEWKIRMDLVEYAARMCPPIAADRVLAYEPKASGATNTNGTKNGAAENEVADAGECSPVLCSVTIG